jgi:peptidoglycan hydrolase CwlO-like protein
MAISGIQHLQNMQAYATAENSRGKIEQGTGDVQKSNQKRKELQAEISKAQAEMKKLEAELAEINDKGWFEKTVAGLFGSDCGAGEVADKMGRLGAEMKKQQQTLMAEQAKIEMMLQELNGVQSEVGEAANARQKAYDERGMSVNNV